MIFIYALIGTFFIAHGNKDNYETAGDLELQWLVKINYSIAISIVESYVLLALVIIIPVLLWYIGYKILKAKFDKLNKKKAEALDKWLYFIGWISTLVLIIWILSIFYSVGLLQPHIHYSE